MKKVLQLCCSVLFAGMLSFAAYRGGPEEMAVSDDLGTEGKYVSVIYVTQHGENEQEQYRRLTPDLDKDVFARAMEMLTDMIGEDAYSEREEHSSGSIYITVHFSDGVGETYYVPDNTSYSSFFAGLVESRFQQLT